MESDIDLLDLVEERNKLLKACEDAISLLDQGLAFKASALLEKAAEAARERRS